MTNTFYTEAYTIKTIVSWTGNQDRLKAVKEVRKSLPSSVKVLDIGTGTGEYSSWIGNEEGCHWTGNDIVSPEVSGVQMPKNGSFIQGDFLAIDVAGKYDLIIDQGAIFTTLEDQERDEYLKKVYSLLNEGGVFLVLTLYATNPTDIGRIWIFNGNRKRVFICKDELQTLNGFKSGYSQIDTYEVGHKNNPTSEVLPIVQVALHKC